jgi:hypothetical protein
MGTGCSAGPSPDEIWTMIFKCTEPNMPSLETSPTNNGLGKQAELEGFLGVFDRDFSQYG